MIFSFSTVRINSGFSASPVSEKEIEPVTPGKSFILESAFWRSERVSMFGCERRLIRMSVASYAWASIISGEWLKVL